MSGSIGLITEAIGEPPSEIVALSDMLDSKVDLKNHWESKAGKAVLKRLQDDSMICLKKLLQFEELTDNEIYWLLSKYRANTILLSTLQETQNIEEIQTMLDKEVNRISEARRPYR
jgi:hypothetical protein